MIRSLLNLKLNKSKKGFKVCVELITFIKKYLNSNKDIICLMNDISKNTNIPKKILQDKLSQELFRSFDFKHNKFLGYEFTHSLKDFLKFYAIVLINIAGHFFLNFNNKEKKSFDLTCDNVFGPLDVKLYSNLIKIFNKTCLLGNYSPKKKIKTEYYFKYKLLLIGNTNTSFKEKFSFILLGVKILYLSIKNRTNLFSLFTLLVYDIFKSSHIFSKIKSKYYITNKFYATSPILRFYFKKNGGKIYSCTQKNICAYSLSLFVFADVMFTLGKHQAKICNKLGGKINRFEPVGSLSMESYWFNQNKISKKTLQSDILILGINTLFNNRHYADSSYEKNYYGYYLSWIKKLCDDYPKKKIIIKHHGSYSIDPKEKKALKDLNIEFLIKDHRDNNSYALAFKSKFVISFCSTMILEILGHGKKAYFSDPNLEGDHWFGDLKNIKQFRLGTYRDIQMKINNTKKNSPLNKSLTNNYCLDSKYTSKKIFNFLKKI